MKESPAHRRMIENQVIFRGFNQRFQKGVEEANRIAAEEGDLPLSLNADDPLYFVCECSDEDCHQRIKISPNTYDAIHKENDQFIIMPGHEALQVEDVIDKLPDYYIVKKHQQPPRSSHKPLQPTSVDNS